QVEGEEGVDRAPRGKRGGLGRRGERPAGRGERGEARGVDAPGPRPVARRRGSIGLLEEAAEEVAHRGVALRRAERGRGGSEGPPHAGGEARGGRRPW